MATVRRSREVDAPPERLWALLSDPYNLPRWWPETVRVEDVRGTAGARRNRFTQVMETQKGTIVRADYRCMSSTKPRGFVWEQELDGTPFEKFLRSSEIEVTLEPGPGGTLVTLAGHRRLRGLSRLGGPMMSRATGRMLERALDGVEEVIYGVAE